MSGKSVPSGYDFNTWNIQNLFPANSQVISWMWLNGTWYQQVIVSLTQAADGTIQLCVARNKGFSGSIDFNANCAIRIFYI